VKLYLSITVVMDIEVSKGKSDLVVGSETGEKCPIINTFRANIISEPQ